MATTTNYGWTTPDDTALVKDGAAAIRSLGTAIDTSMNTALGTKKAGLVLLNTTSFSAVSSVSLAANTFTSTYENYKIMIYFDTSASVNISGRLRASGTDASGNDYYSTYMARTTGASYDTQEGNPSTAFKMNNTTANAIACVLNIELFRPQLADNTSITGTLVDGSQVKQGVFGGRHTLDTAYDSFSIIPSSGTITGSYSVFGYNK